MQCATECEAAERLKKFTELVHEYNKSVEEEEAEEAEYCQVRTMSFRYR